MASNNIQQASSYPATADYHGNRNTGYGQHASQVHVQQGPNGPVFVPREHAMVSAGHSDLNLRALSQSLSGIPVTHPNYVGPNKPNPATVPDFSGVSIAPAAMAATVYAGNGQVMPMYTGQYMPGAGVQHTPGMYTPIGTHFLNHAGYQPYHQHMVDNSPLSATWTPRVQSGEMPSLITPRRDSLSSNEQDTPGTPLTGYGPYGGVAVYDRSPHAHAVYANSTPSPTNPLTPYIFPLFGKAPQHQSQPPLEIQMLVAKEPSIPRAIPAPSSPVKPLDRSLENKDGGTNVYIRGLQPETTDEMLYAWGSRFGDIESSKSIIDHATGLCKGFGFIKYYNYKDAENCIRGFHYLGYEVSFARESFYSKLKKFSDENNTNLYVSNLPRDMNEHELGAIFSPHQPCSCKVLRTPDGAGRGVGFARFESREVCEDIIKNFNNTPISKQDGEEYSIQIRYADTEQQKWFKQSTAVARQFRSGEYECAVQARNQALLTGSTPLPSAVAGDRNELENYHPVAAGLGIKGPRFAQPWFRQLPGRSPLSVMQMQSNRPTAQSTTNASIKTESTTTPNTPAIARGGRSIGPSSPANVKA